MKPLRVLVLMHESLVPPASLKGYSDKEIDEFRTEYDVVANLEKAGHTVRALGLGDNLGELRTAITDWKPDVAFNLLEEFQGIVTYDQYVVAFLELMKLTYTGCNPRGMMISRDKTLSKQILSYHRIPTPKFACGPCACWATKDRSPATPARPWPVWPPPSRMWKCAPNLPPPPDACPPSADCRSSRA